MKATRVQREPCGRPESDSQHITAENVSRSPRSAGSAWAREKRFASVLGRLMAYVGEGRPLVLLHANPTSSFLWRGVLPHVEAPGNGRRYREPPDRRA
jgi:pimeloyl-ACP methyl ester carboxylesterase